MKPEPYCKDWLLVREADYEAIRSLLETAIGLLGMEGMGKEIMDLKRLYREFNKEK